MDPGYIDQDYDIYGDTIYSKASALALDYVAKVAEDVLPPYFVRLLVLELAVRMSMSITASAGMKGTLIQEKQLQFAAALAADAQQRPNRPFFQELPRISLAWQLVERLSFRGREFVHHLSSPITLRAPATPACACGRTTTGSSRSLRSRQVSRRSRNA